MFLMPSRYRSLEKMTIRFLRANQSVERGDRQLRRLSRAQAAWAKRTKGEVHVYSLNPFRDALN
jgi:hypothetical protein